MCRSVSSRAQDAVLDRRQGPVGDPLVERHPAAPRRAGLGHPRAEDEVGLAVDDRRDQLRDQPGLVLAVGMQHDHDLGAALKRLEVARLLVAAVADVVRVPDHVDAELAGDLERLVGGAVVDEDHLVDAVARDRRRPWSRACVAAFSAGITTTVFGRGGSGTAGLDVDAAAAPQRGLDQRAGGGGRQRERAGGERRQRAAPARIGRRRASGRRIAS